MSAIGFTSDELDLDAFAPKARFLTVSLVVREDRGDGATGQVVGRERLRLGVPETLSVPATERLLAIQSRASAALVAADGDEELFAAIVDAAAAIADEIAVLNPGMFEPFTFEPDGRAVRAMRRLEPSPNQTLVMLSWLLAGEAVARDVAAVLSEWSAEVLPAAAVVGREPAVHGRTRDDLDG